MRRSKPSASRSSRCPFVGSVPPPLQPRRLESPRPVEKEADTHDLTASERGDGGQAHAGLSAAALAAAAPADKGHHLIPAVEDLLDLLLHVEGVCAFCQQGPDG